MNKYFSFVQIIVIGIVLDGCNLKKASQRRGD